MALGAVLVGLWVYPHVALTPDQARIRIVQMGLPYDAGTFVEMAKKDDEQVVNLFLRAGMAPDAKDFEGKTALMWAAYYGHLGLVKSLIEKGADPNAALSEAAYSGQKDIFNLLLASKPSQDAINNALVTAAAGHQTEIARKLIDLGADVNGLGGRGGRYPEVSAPLYAAASALDLEIVRLLLSRGVNPNGRDEWNKTPLNEAIHRNVTGDQERQQAEIVQALLEHGADVSRRGIYINETQLTPLLVAIAESHPEIALLLIEHGADVNAQAVDWRTRRNISALMWAADKGLTDVVKTLLAKGAVGEPEMKTV